MLTGFRNIFSPPRHLMLMVIAIWVGLSLAEKRADRHGIGKDELSSLTFYSVIAFLFGGRISFVLQNVPAFSQSPLDMISINPELFDLLGAAIVALLAAFIYAQGHGLFRWSTLDALTPIFATAAIGLGLSHIAAGTAFGLPTNLPWAIDLWSDNRHPTQIYETLGAMLTFALLWFRRRRPHAGGEFLLFMEITAGYQLFIGAFRADSRLLLNAYKADQVIAWSMLALGFALSELAGRRSKKL